MTRRLLGACVCAVVVTLPAGPAPVTAKPPDLPMNQKDTVTPQTGGEEESESRAPLFGGCVAEPPVREANGVGAEVQPDTTGPGPGCPPSGRPCGDARIEVKDSVTGSVLFGLGVHGDMGLTGGILLNAGPSTPVPLPAPVGNAVNGAGMSPCAACCPCKMMCPMRGLSHLTPSVRRNLACSLLFGVHPLLALAPTDEFLDCPGDHPQPAPAGALFEDVPASEDTNGAATGNLLFGIGLDSDVGLTGNIGLNETTGAQGGWLKWLFNSRKACAPAAQQPLPSMPAGELFEDMPTWQTPPRLGVRLRQGDRLDIGLTGIRIELECDEAWLHWLLRRWSPGPSSRRSRPAAATAQPPRARRRSRTGPG